IRDICAAMLNASAGRLDEVKTSLEEYQRAGYQLGLTVQFVLLCPALLLHNEPRGGAGADRSRALDRHPQQRAVL
ncbi:MAG: hypothetical protein WBW28_02835, partial [Pseudolabrys sp.]